MSSPDRYRGGDGGSHKLSPFSTLLYANGSAIYNCPHNGRTTSHRPLQGGHILLLDTLDSWTQHRRGIIPLARIRNQGHPCHSLLNVYLLQFFKLLCSPPPWGNIHHSSKRNTQNAIRDTILGVNPRPHRSNWRHSSTDIWISGATVASLYPIPPPPPHQEYPESRSFNTAHWNLPGSTRDKPHSRTPQTWSGLWAMEK